MDDLSTEKLLELLVDALSRSVPPSDCSPTAIYSKQMMRTRFQISRHRIDRMAQEVSRSTEAIENGDNIIAPLSVWCQVMRSIPRDPRPKKPARRQPKKD